ncbi:hypothetical protein Tco_1450201 [Tanacetum coccineum]
MPQLVIVSNIARLDQVVITLASRDTGQGFNLYSLSSLSTFVRGIAVYVSTSPKHRARRFIFNQVVEDAWKKEVNSCRPDCVLRDRLKNVKASLKAWSKERFGENKAKIKSLRNEAMRWELEAEKRTLSDVERERPHPPRTKLSDHCPIILKEVDSDFCFKPFRVFNVGSGSLSYLYQSQIEDLAWKKSVSGVKERFGENKAKIKSLRNEAMRWELEAEKRTLIRWDVEGDENSKFFHAFVKRRNNKCNLRGLMVDGVWYEDPKIIKAEMAKHYKKLFSKLMVTQPVFCNNNIEKISREDIRWLEKPFDKKEVWDAIRGVEGIKRQGLMVLTLNSSVKSGR